MKCLSQRELIVWGDGTPTRDFLFAEDVADGLLLAAEKLEPPGYVNLGAGTETSIRRLVEFITHSSGFSGPVSYDASKSGALRTSHFALPTGRCGRRTGLRRATARPVEYGSHQRP